MDTEIPDKMLKGGEVLWQGSNALVGNFTDGNLDREFPVTVQVEIQIICKNQVVERSAVPVELLFVAGFLFAFQVLVPDILDLDKAHGDILFGRPNDLIAA
jgi:hypothetical protein